jgi:hypothetical protein
MDIQFGGERFPRWHPKQRSTIRLDCLITFALFFFFFYDFFRPLLELREKLMTIVIMAQPEMAGVGIAGRSRRECWFVGDPRRLVTTNSSSQAGRLL